jgi:LacI family transcriptional regulator
VFAGVCEYAQKHADWRVVVDEWADHNLPRNAGKKPPYDGLIGRISSLGAQRAKLHELPVVNVWFNSPVVDKLPGVFHDYVAAGRLRAEHLLARGFRSFGAVVHAGYRATEVQADGFQQALREAGIRQYHQVTVNYYGYAMPNAYRQWQRNRKLLNEWLDRLKPPIGLYIYEIYVAREIIEMCHERGWRVPEDVAMIAGMEEGPISERPEPSLTSLDLPYEQIGYEAARLLDKLIDAKEQHASHRRNIPPSKQQPPETILLPPVGIVARRSTDFFAVDDTLVRRALRYIDDQLHRGVAIDDLARALDVSRRTLTDRFRDKLKRSVAEEIQRLRLQRAKREPSTAATVVRAA